ncbi:MAG TPA: thymidine phosphorylase, partial [Rugosimonospora sp.]|nr:thymidine phosphorylase [Rugosimonospora sp.]
VLRRRPGDPVRAGEPLFELRADDPRRIPDALVAAQEAVQVAGAPPQPAPLVLERVGEAGWQS